MHIFSYLVILWSVRKKFLKHKRNKVQKVVCKGWNKFSILAYQDLYNWKGRRVRIIFVYTYYCIFGFIFVREDLKCTDFLVETVVTAVVVQALVATTIAVAGLSYYYYFAIVVAVVTMVVIAHGLSF